MSSIRIIALAAGLAVAVFAADDRSPAAKTPAAPVASGGAVVFVDPATGKMVQPSAAAIGTLAPQPASGPAPKAPVQQIQGPGTAVAVRLGPDQMSYAVATVGADGKLSTDCVTGEKAATRKVGSGLAKARRTPRAKGGHDEH